MPTHIAYAVAGRRSLCAIARELIASGHDPETLVTWTRNSVPIFIADKPRRWWAGRMVDEGSRGLNLVKYRPRRKLRGKPATAATCPSDGSPYPGDPDSPPDARPHREDGE